jgi:hypothetical protein
MPWHTELKEEAGGLTGIRTQLERPLILDTVARIRAASHFAPIADRPGLGRMALSVPLEDWHRLRGKYPDLASQDAQIRSAAWLRFMRTPEAEPFKLREVI